jgi:hypothetical protein
MRRQAALLLALLLPTVSFASTVTVDYTDMWWNPRESGWGANVVQQGDTMFVTLFVYDGASNPQWFAAPQVTYQGGGVFTGQLYRTTGAFYFQRSFDPTAVTVTPVGQLTFNASTATVATLTYNVNGFEITKDITRLSWRTDNLTGFYIGARQGVWSGCGAALNGKVDSAATLGVSEQPSGQVQIRDAGKGYTCNYSGLHSQTGHVGVMTGTGVCDDNVSRFLAATEIQVSPIMFSMRYRMEQIGTECVFEGYLGGVRQAQ